MSRDRISNRSSNLVEVAMGREKADLVIQNGSMGLCAIW